MSLVYAIIPAAGQGRRFGAAKQFQLLDGKPIFLHSLEAFEACPLIQGVCLVVPSSEERSIRQIVEKQKIKKILKILPGGEERQESVKNGFAAIAPCDIIVVHDGVRPFVTPSLIEKTVVTAREFGGCVPGLPVKETVKRATEESWILETVDRSSLWNIQTPQAFAYEIFKKALEKADRDHFRGTDEASLVERTGVKIRLIEGSPTNIKITTPEDLLLAESILKVRRSK